MSTLNGYTPDYRTGNFLLGDGVYICTKIERICPEFGFHVALTGGCLYGVEGRKDIDIVFYRIRQVRLPDTEGLLKALAKDMDIQLISDHGFVKKLNMGGTIPIDAMFPEDVYGDYPVDAIQKGELIDGGAPV